MIHVAPQRAQRTTTSVSGSVTASIPAGDRKSPTTLGNARVARRVHRFALAVPSSLASTLVLLSLIGCVVPPSLNPEDSDGGVNHPPVIHQVRDGAGQVLGRPGPLTLVVGAGEVIISAADTDLGDTLYARMYIDYGLDDETPFRVQCEAAPGEMPAIERSITCPLLGLCTDGLIDGTVHVFELDVLDRMPTTTSDRPFRGVTPPGEISTFWWNLSCVAPS